MLRREADVRTNVSEGRIATIIRVTRIGELVTTLALTSSVVQLLVKCGDGKHIASAGNQTPAFEQIACPYSR
jgi:hypothetical protein